MLSNEQIESNKQNFESILRKVAQLNPDRAKSIEDIIKYLEQTDFFKAPASTKYHQGYAGGLCEHSLGVYNYLVKIIKDNDIQNIPEESIIVTALLHDLCKIGMYIPYVQGHYKKDENGKDVLLNGKKQWVEEDGYAINPNLSFHAGHSAKSIFFINQFLKLTAEEYEAIYWHMGAFDTGNYSSANDMSRCFEQNKLAFALHMADMYDAYLNR